MNIINYGSYCIDNVYSVDHFVKPGETIPSRDYQVYPGGKGLNQSLALANAGVKVKHAGKIGPDGVWLRDLLNEAGVDTSLTQVIDSPSGHANIQVTPEGENAIVIYGGANQKILPEDFDAVFADAEVGDILLIQNETSYLPQLIEYAAAKQQRIVFNAAPFTEEVSTYPLARIEYFILNELEAAALSGETDPALMLPALLRKYPHGKFVLTLGKDGVHYLDADQHYHQAAFSVTAVDTTGAGDTFTGFFLAGIVLGLGIPECLRNACKAGAICVTRAGAATSIPTLSELDQLI